MKEPKYRVLSTFDTETKESFHVPQKKYLGFFWWDLFRKCDTLEEAETIVIMDRNFTW